MKLRLPVVSLALVILVACGGGEPEPDGAPTTTAAPSCPASGGAYSGPTSEDLCVSFETDASGESITRFEIEVIATCTLGFGEGSVTLTSENETVTSSEAAPDAGTPFEMTVSVEAPIEVDASGAFQSGNLAGTITGTDAQGTYELAFTATLLEEFSCSGGPVTWTASTA